MFAIGADGEQESPDCGTTDASHMLPGCFCTSCGWSSSSQPVGSAGAVAGAPIAGAGACCSSASSASLCSSGICGCCFSDRRRFFLCCSAMLLGLSDVTRADKRSLLSARVACCCNHRVTATCRACRPNHGEHRKVLVWQESLAACALHTHLMPETVSCSQQA